VTVGTVAATGNLGTGSRTTTDTRVMSPFGVGNSDRPSYWFYFPGEPDGPVMLRATSAADSGSPVRRILQNANGNYSYEGRTVTINNYRMWMSDLKSVFSLPTDNSTMRTFLSRMQGKDPEIQPVDARGRGLLVVAERSTEGEDTQPWAIRYGNVLTEDYFQSNWRSDATIVDNRDAMHKRGWTYFRVSGRLNGRTVNGVGQVPFIYSMARNHGPWLKLQVGDLTLTDSDTGACVLDARGTVLNRYARGGFFKGLSRPWMGLHTIDTVRRDAAERQTPFQTTMVPDSKDVQVTVVYGQMRLVYRIDMETDVVKSIALSLNQAPIGQLDFEYFQDLPPSRDFIAPRTTTYRGPSSEDIGILWLVRLANGTLIRSAPLASGL